MMHGQKNIKINTVRFMEGKKTWKRKTFLAKALRLITQGEHWWLNMATNEQKQPMQSYTLIGTWTEAKRCCVWVLFKTESSQ